MDRRDENRNKWDVFRRIYCPDAVEYYGIPVTENTPMPDREETNPDRQPDDAVLTPLYSASAGAPDESSNINATESPPQLPHPEHTLGAPRARQYEQHDLSALFPRMEPDAFARLVESIREQGLLEPITIADGKILDGFHRDEACYVAGRKPDYVPLDPKLDKLDFVFGKNFDRRQMTVSQASVVAAKAATLPRGRPAQMPGRDADTSEAENKKDKNIHLTGDGQEAGETAREVKPNFSENPHSDPQGQDADIATNFVLTDTKVELVDPQAAPIGTAASDVMLSNAQAAKLAGVSRASIVIAKRLLSGGNDRLVDAVMQHGMSNGHALALSKLPVDDQIEAIHYFVEGKQEGEKRVKRKAGEKKAVERSKKDNAGIDVTCVVPGESQLLTISRVIHGIDWAIEFFKAEVPNEGLQHRYDKLLARAKAFVDNDHNVKKVRLVF